MHFTSIVLSATIVLASVASVFAAETPQCRGGSRQNGCSTTKISAADKDKDKEPPHRGDGLRDLAE